VEHLNEKKREQENVLRLVKKSRKGILRVVFSRFGLMGCCWFWSWCFCG